VQNPLGKQLKERYRYIKEGHSMDFIQIANQLQQSKNDLKENWCLINGFPYQLEQIEKMSLNELSGRSFENLPKKLYKFFPDICDGKCNYSIMALESNEV